MIILFLLLGVLLESSVTTLPLTLIILLFSAVVSRKNEVFVFAFFAGLLLDILILRPIGLSSLFFVLMVFVTLMYERKFETNTPLFIFGLSFLASIFYSLINGSSNFIFSSLFVSLFGVVSFVVFRLTSKKVETYG